MSDVTWDNMCLSEFFDYTIVPASKFTIVFSSVEN